jgi:arylsulfatase A-like enzyme
MKRLIALAAILSAASVCGAVEKPNIVLILADDIGFETLACYGGSSYQTPHIDRLAADGMRFDSCLATPMCATSRAMLLSGRYNFRNYQRWAYLDASEPTIASHLRTAGYTTAMAGKWHLGNWDPDAKGKRGPARMGFEHYLSYVTDSPPPAKGNHNPPGNRYWQTTLIDNDQERRLPPGRNSEDEYVDYTLAFFREHQDKPFFFHYASNLAHRPMVAMQNPGKEDLNENGKAKNFPEMIRKFDEVVGRLRKGIEDLGMKERTVFILTSDNGTDNVWEAGKIRSTWRGKSVPGGKYHANETGTTVPLIAWWPGQVAAGSTTRAPLDFTDFLPTFVNLAGGAPCAVTDGRNFRDILLGSPPPDARRYAYTWGTLDGSNTAYHDPKQQRNQILHELRDERWRYLSDGRIFDILRDPLMEAPVDPSSSPEAEKARQILKTELDRLLKSKPRLW